MDGESAKLTRGRLLKTGAVAALAAGAGGAGSVLAGAAAGAGAVDAGPGIGKPGRGKAYLRRSTYAPLIGTRFKVHRPGERTLKVKLISARQLPSAGDSFSLTFRTGRTPSVESRIYRLEHPALGSFELFLSPVDRGVKGLDLEAVINRIAT
ncbi:MAG: DUF6916 family protein [Gaiellaceae bacterium]